MESFLFIKKFLDFLVRSVFLLSCLFLAACGAGKDKTNVELIQDMMNQKSIKSQEEVMLPPENTVPQGYKPYPYKVGEFEKASKGLKNPFYNVRLADILLRGKKNYDFHCAVCHGEKGRGDGPVAGQMIVRPPTLLSKKVRDFTDGRLFHIITKGQGLMGAYIQQIPESKDRWALVNYIRNLQRLEKE